MQIGKSYSVTFKICNSVHHRTIEINHQPDVTVFQFIILTFIYSSACFGRSPAHRQEHNDCRSSLWFYLRIVVIAMLCSWSCRLARPWTQHGYHHDAKVKSEAAPAVIVLLMMGGRTTEKFWAVNKRQDNKLKIVASGWWFIWIILWLRYQIYNLDLSYFPQTHPPKLPR
jgi:hypothetical protein